MSKIFVSHSTEDLDFVEGVLIPLLRDQGLEFWYSPDSIRTADVWEHKIVAALRSCDWFLIVLSPNSVTSEWVRAEVHWAMEERPGRIVPILFQECESDDLHLKLRQIQFVDFTQDSAAARARLLATWADLDGYQNVATVPQARTQGRHSRVFFNNGWDGFDPDTDKDVLFYLWLAAPQKLVHHIEFLRPYKSEVYTASERGLGVDPRAVSYPYEDYAALSVCFGSSKNGKQSESNYYRFLKCYDPNLPDGISLDKLSGNNEAMWSWSMGVPEDWLQEKPPFVTNDGKKALRDTVDSWIFAHNAEVERIKNQG